MPYPNVYEQRPTRGAKPLTEEEQKRLESELGNLRDSQNKRALAPEPPPPTPKVKDAAKAPPKTQPKAPPKKTAEKKAAEPTKPKPDRPAKKSEDSLVPDQKGPSLKPIQ